jgi:hypothetical protein
VSLSWQVDPKQSVVPLGRDPMLIKSGGNLDLPFELAVIDFHGNDSHRFPRDREGVLVLLLQGFRCFTTSPDPQPARSNFKLDLLGFNAGQFNADSKTGGALEDIDRRAPLKIGVTKIGKMDFRDLVGDLANLTLEMTQANCSNLSAHRQQWMRWSDEATESSPMGREFEPSDVVDYADRSAQGVSWAQRLHDEGLFLPRWLTD